MCVEMCRNWITMREKEMGAKEKNSKNKLMISSTDKPSLHECRSFEIFLFI